MDDIESQTPISPPYRSTFVRNRSLFAIFDVVLLLANSFWAHGKVSRSIIAVPSIDITSFPGQFQNNTKVFSDALVAEIDVQNAVIGTEINTTLELEISRVEMLLSLNTQKLNSRLLQESNIRNAYNDKVIYLQAWSRVGNTVPYRPSATYKDRYMFETMLSLENGAIIEELAGNSNSLSDQLKARYEYDVEYLRNKTSGLIPKLIPDIKASLHLPHLDADIRARVLLVYEELAAQLRPVRDYIAEVYESLSLQLHATELAFGEMAVRYDLLISTIRRFYQILDSINIVGFNKGLFPRVDLKSFPPPAFFLPDSIAFPSTIDFLKPFDIILLKLESPFDLLANDIFHLVDVSLDIKASEIVAALIDALTPDDYFPPSIEFQGKAMSLPDALQMNSEIIANLTVQANQLPKPPIVTDSTTIELPKIKYEQQNFDFAQPVVDLFAWSMPNLDRYFSLLKEIIVFLWGYYIKIEVFVINIYRALRRAFEYFEGTAVPLPVIDLRTKVEQEDGQRRNRRGRVAILASYIFHPLIFTVLSRLLLFLFFVAVIIAGSNYYFDEFHPNCVMSNKGTSIGNFAIGPLLYNRALAAGQHHAINLSIANHAYVEQQCQRQGLITYDTYRQQVFDYEASRLRSTRDLKGLQNIEDVVDLDLLCQQYKLACTNDDSTIICPILDNGSIVGNPCEFVSTDSQISTEVLQVVEFNCSSVPHGELTLDGTRDRAQKELGVEESWCLVEWWFIGHLWRIIFVLVGYITLYNSFRWIIDGLQTFFWTLLRPEWWHIQCTADRHGFFTQPEYSDTDAKEKAIQEWNLGHKCTGVAKLFVGTSMFVGWVVVAIATWRIDMVPSWYINES
jgi:hypothetical protein